jgi:hypothetical protein
LFPGTRIAPHMMMSSFTFEKVVGSWSIAFAILVSGQRAIIVMLSFHLRSDNIFSTALSVIFPSVLGSIPSSPLSQWTMACTRSLLSGFPDPEYIGISLLQRRSSTYSAFLVTFLILEFPATVVTANISSPALIASMIAIASSCPGSVSMMYFLD